MSTQRLASAIVVETRKALASPVLTSAAILLVVGVTAIAAGGIAAAQGGNEQLAAKLGPLALDGGWPGLLNVAAQVTAAGGMVAFGVGLGWCFGREFTDGTIAGLFALPVSRATLALAKLIVYLLWTVVTAAALVVAVAVTAAAVTRQAPGAADGAALGRLFALAVMTGALPVPAAWAATVGRGILPAIATTVVLMAATQIVVVAGGTGAWFPFAAPALWAVLPGSVSAAQLLAAAVVPVAFAALALRAWHRLQLDR